LSTDVKQLEKKTTKDQIVVLKTMIERKDSSPEEKLAQEENLDLVTRLLEDMENSQKLMILMIRHLVCIKRKAKNFMLKNQLKRKRKKRHQRKLKTRRSNKFNIKKTTLKLVLMKKEKTQMKKKRRRSNQKQRKDNLTVLPSILPISRPKLARSLPNIKNLRLPMKNMKQLKKLGKKLREKLRKQLRRLRKRQKPKQKPKKKPRKRKKKKKV